MHIFIPFKILFSYSLSQNIEQNLLCYIIGLCCLLLLFSRQVVSDSLWPHGLQDTRLPCPSPSPGICPSSCPWNGEAEAPILWPPDANSQLIGKDSDAGKDWGQEEKRVTEDEGVGFIWAGLKPHCQPWFLSGWGRTGFQGSREEQEWWLRWHKGALPTTARCTISQIHLTLSLRHSLRSPCL